MIPARPLLLLLIGCAAPSEPLLPQSSDDAGSSQDADAGAAPLDAGCPNEIATVDFPCEQPFRCLDEREYIRQRTVWCEEFFGDGCPCSGGTCRELQGIERCPEGTRCNTTPTPFVEDVACVPDERTDGG